MGGAADLPQRSSSPLKRRASDLDAEPEVKPSQKEDVDMIETPQPEQQESTDTSISTQTATPADEGSDTTASTQTTGDDSISKPPIDEQIKIVTNLLEGTREHQIQDGQEVYLVSRRWLERVMCRGTTAREKSKVEPEGEIGPIDNSDLIQDTIKDCDGKDFVRLKQGLNGESFEYFPVEIWTIIFGWYGILRGTIPIIRTAHNTNNDKYGLPNIQYELHPPVFTIHRLWSEFSPINVAQKLKVQNPPAPITIVSRSTNYNKFLKQIKSVAGIEISQKVRVWRVPRLQPAAEPVINVLTATPPPSRPGSPVPATIETSAREPQDSWTGLLLDVATFLQLEKGTGRELIELPDQTNNANYNGHSDLSFAGLGDSQSLVIDENIAGENFVSNYVAKDKKAAKSGRGTSTLSTSQTNSGRSSPAPSGPMTRGRTGAQKSGRTPGTVGLSNLGNTCYMNSALQCVRSVEELTKYFVTGASEAEINEDNPLGNHGNVARAYGKLLKQIYTDNAPTSVAPRDFKSVIGKYAPSFSGYGQQDSQEFLGFLLDGLQEDLSRVKKKPYIEKPDSTDEMINDPEAIREMAAKVWDISKKRDDSVIADLFTGMYKSTLVCPICSKISITFDPFNNLTLQLPIESTWQHTVFYFPMNDKPIRITVDIDKHASIRVVKEYIAKRVGTSVERLFMTEVFKSKFYRHFEDIAIASEDIGAQDNIAVFELELKPTNWPLRKIKGKGKFSNDSEEEVPSWDDPMADRLLVPVFYRYPNNDPSPRYSLKKDRWHSGQVPHFIMLTPEEAKDEDMIRRKIIEKAATLTTLNLDDELDTDESVSGSIDPDIVLANGSDASVEGKVIATSIDGEDGLVDVTMKDSANADTSSEIMGASESSDSPSASPGLNFNKRRPKYIEPSSFLRPGLQNIFQISYFQSKTALPTGWSDVDESKDYPLLSSRAPEVEEKIDDTANIGYERTGSESDEDDEQPTSTFGVTRMNDEESSDEDELSRPTPPPIALPHRSKNSSARVGQRKRGKQFIKTYSSKGNQLYKKAPGAETPQEIPEGGPLVRLGEGLIVDWNNDAWETLFGSNDPADPMRGCPTYSQVPEWKDPELIAKKKARETRRKHGITLDDCLNEFGKEEVLSEQDTWYCPRCKEHRRATKKFELWRTPDILVMHLKRFSSSAYRRDKVDVLVDFPIDGLDLSSRVIERQEGKEEIYDLFAVDDHWGGLGGGHYTAFAKNFNDGAWYEYNDSSASKQRDTSRIVTASAYLLFYRRRSDKPLGGPRFQEIHNVYENSTAEASEDDTESGEDRGLVTNSSLRLLRGSSSALTGVGAAHRATSSLGSQLKTVDNADEELPAYENIATDSNPIADIEMNDGLQLQESIEDEGVGLDDDNSGVANYHNPMEANWDWSALNDLKKVNRPPGAGSEDDGINSDVFDQACSDIVEHNSSASSSSLRNRMHDFSNASPPPEGEFEEPTPVPDLDTSLLADEQFGGILSSLPLHPHGEILHEKVKLIPRDDDDEVAEIHVEEGEGLDPSLD